MCAARQPPWFPVSYRSIGHGKGTRTLGSAIRGILRPAGTRVLAAGLPLKLCNSVLQVLELLI